MAPARSTQVGLLAALAALALVQRASALAATPTHGRFVSPLFEDGYLAERVRPELPRLLYLPGFDGTLVAPFVQFPMLSDDYDIEGLASETEDRSTFAALVEEVTTHLLAEPIGRPLYLMGESFGGILALSVALELARSGRPLAGLGLINPATCYLESDLALKAMAIIAKSDSSILPSVTYVQGVLSLLPLFGDRHMLPQILQLVGGAKLPEVIDTPAREAYMGRVAFSLPCRLKFIPREALRWRLEEWLATGARHVQQREMELCALTQPTVIVAGSADAALPSVAEAQRLAALLPDACVHVVPGAGHASTCGIRVNLLALLRSRFAGGGPTGAQRAPLGVAPLAPELDPDLGLIPRPHPAVSPLAYWSTPGR
ncbi:Alpha/Beta hydrolase protein [Pavlovales sp. CCMP2436]|nr:Alpha/Beta hydrolase protein [Pavlovales sp. CCMP2436]